MGWGVGCEGWVGWDGVAMPFDITRSTSSASLTSMTLGTLPPMTSGAMPFDITRWDMPSNYIVAKYTPQKAGCEQRSVFLPGGWEGGRGRG